jgi:hypothetical protein
MAPDGRFLALVPTGTGEDGPSTSRIITVLNWFEELTERVPVD